MKACGCLIWNDEVSAVSRSRNYDVATLLESTYKMFKKKKKQALHCFFLLWLLIRRPFAFIYMLCLRLNQQQLMMRYLKAALTQITLLSAGGTCWVSLFKRANEPPDQFRCGSGGQRNSCLTVFHLIDVIQHPQFPSLWLSWSKTQLSLREKWRFHWSHGAFSDREKCLESAHIGTEEVCFVFFQILIKNPLLDIITRCSTV